IMFIEIPQANFRRLPFDHSLEYPMCTVDGVVFDLMSIVPWIKKFGTNPITGEKLEAKYLIKLNISKNNEGKYHCPVLYTVFTNNSHIVANKVTGNVFSYEADLITLQVTGTDSVSPFLSPTDEEKAKQDPSYHLKSTNLEMRETLAELYRDYKGDELLASTMKEPEAKKTDKLNAAHYSTGRVSASFTSTAMAPATTHEAGNGVINEMLPCLLIQNKSVPKAGENFIKLCKKGYYDGTIFHRSIRNFMIQGGDPTGTGTGGESFWGKPFKDEFRPNLSHTGRGILSMANSGPNTNKSQFFITFRSCTYLDRKHTVFGRVVGGLETLTAMENVESDPKTDKPKSEIKLLSTTVFVDPYEEADAQIAAEREKEAQKQEEERAQTSASVNKAKTEDKPKTFRPGVGKYINMTATKHSHPDGDKPSTSEAPAKKPKGRTGFGDFSSW
uniref:RING-type E3 ubiquitin-protein ligase PPIL2 n=1 Tax=Sinocyclocheilus rhinocerous TaxID=307959 RepID=A0A673JIH8_9TELE